MGADCVMPMASRPKKRSDGTPFTIDDKEYWALERDGGIRQPSTADYPRMLYRALRNSKGQVRCMELPPTRYGFATDLDYELAVKASEQFTQSCQRIVSGPREFNEALDEGWCESPTDTDAVFERGVSDVARAAAEAAHAVQRMSSTAQAEYAHESATNPEHVTDIQPKRRGRPTFKATTTE